jgi:hypothetical protein
MSEFNLGDKPTSKPSSTTPEKAKQKTLTLPKAESLPENQNPDLMPPHGGTNPDAAALPDFDAAPLPADEIQAEVVAVGEGSADKVTPSGFMTYEAFDQLFCTTFLISGHATGFQTLVQAPELSSRPDATKAMYEAILDTPALHFIINPQSLWMQRAFAMGAFFVPVALGVAGEMRAKKTVPAKVAAVAPGRPAQDDAKSMRDELRGKKKND